MLKSSSIILAQRKFRVLRNGPQSTQYLHMLKDSVKPPV